MLLELGPQISLEPVVEGPVVEMAEATHAGVEDTTKLVAKRFKRQPKDALGSTSACSRQGFLLLVNKIVITSIELCLPQLISLSPQQHEVPKNYFEKITCS
jgi:hypothetical protein